MRSQSKLIRILSPLVIVVAVSSCSDDFDRRIGDFCSNDSDCESGICYEDVCLDPDGDLDSDGLNNGTEKNVVGTNLASADTDNDGVPDLDEVGTDPKAPLDYDGDDQIDALESRLVSADPDQDCLPDEYDAENTTFSVDTAVLVELNCSLKGVCGDGTSSISATCESGAVRCNYEQVPFFQETESDCDGKDNDCDGVTDPDGLSRSGAQECEAVGVCALATEKIFQFCSGAAWTCDYSAVDGFEADETSCDGADNDCDGNTDENLIGNDCLFENDFGKCPGKSACSEEGGEPICVGATAEAESCNGVDDDCDGDTDEDLVGLACANENDFGTCTGITSCAEEGGGTICIAQTPTEEKCNSFDDDCDGDTDDDDVCLRKAIIRVQAFTAMTPIAFGMTLNVSGSTMPVLDGVKIDIVTAEECELTDIPTYSGYTTTDGIGEIPVEAGGWCVIMTRDGYAPVRTDTFSVKDDETFSFDVVMAPAESSPQFFTVCGRVLEIKTALPVEGAMVTIIDTLAELELDSATTDENGSWCIWGIVDQYSPETYLSVSVMHSAYKTYHNEFARQDNEVRVLSVALTPLPHYYSTCLRTGFEIDTYAGVDWERSEPLNGVGWNFVRNGSGLVNSALGKCVSLGTNEMCYPTDENCALCGENLSAERCIPRPGGLPNSTEGFYTAWFGNPESGNTLGNDDVCGKLGTTVSGTLTSPWVQATGGSNMYVEFYSAWEVEGNDPMADLLLLQIQTSEMQADNSWATVGDIKSPDGTTISPVEGALSSGGTGMAPTWVLHQFDLTSWVGSMSRIRFAYDSTDGNYNYYRGWLIDGLLIRGTECNVVR